MQKSLKITFFDIFQVSEDTFGIQAPVNDGTHNLITSIRHKPNIGRNKREKFDVDGGNKRIK